MGARKVCGAALPLSFNRLCKFPFFAEWFNVLDLLASRNAREFRSSVSHTCFLSLFMPPHFSPAVGTFLNIQVGPGML